jgi:protein-S-isoprenylcysteine O-methyltransferase Ste14
MLAVSNEDSGRGEQVMSTDKAETGKDGAAVGFPPPLLPLATVLAGLALDRWLPLLRGYELPTPARYWIGGMLVAAALLLLGLLPVVMFRRSGQSEIPWRPTPSILEHGPYRFTRNPMYLQMVLVCIGVAIITSNAWILLLTPLCAWALRRFAIAPEEAYLARKFGEPYRAYQRRVRRWL